MIVECPRCRARYRVEAEILGSNQTFKCSRCSHIFAYEAAAANVEGSEETAPTGAESAPLVPPSPTAAKPESRRAAPRRDEDSLSFSFSGKTKPADEDFSFDEIEESEPDLEDAEANVVQNEPRFIRGEDDVRVDEEDRGSGGRPYFLFLGALIIAYAILALDLRNHPSRTEKLLAAIPVFGDLVAGDHLLQTRVQLRDLEGVYQQIKDERRVFIVSGRAVNASTDPLKGVQIESALYDAAGRVIEVKNIYCGNAMSLKVVKDLSAKEISLLQGLEPTKRFEIPPGESAGFSVVFVSPPPGLKEFTARVVAAQSSMT